MYSILARSVRVPVLLVAALTLSSCDIFGTAGGFFISEADEVQLGSEFNQQLRDSSAAFPIYNANTPDKVAFQNYVKGLAQEILDSLDSDEKPDYPFTFTIIDQDIQNAFAVPGGFVYIYTGIIRTMKDESELAGVLGHEIAHVTQHHYRDALAKQAGISLLIDALVGDNAGAIKQLVAQSFASLSSLAVTRSNESEADDYGTRSMGVVRRNPLGIAKYFSRQEDAGFEWLSTHPAPPNRVKDVQDQVNASAKLKALAADSAVTNYKSRFDTFTAVIR